jgi:hypothetical protein
MQDVTRRLRDIPNVKPCCSDLIQERLELVVVVPIDQQDVYGFAFERLHAFQTAVTYADHHHARSRHESI